MKNPASILVVPCRSNLPDRQYDCVALYFSKAQRDALKARTVHFQRLRDQDGCLYPEGARFIGEDDHGT